MEATTKTLLFIILGLCLGQSDALLGASGPASLDTEAMKREVVSMFKHAFDSYMERAWPADELMPLSCRGRVRGVTPSRGDVDDALGNFSLTLVDSLDTLVVLGLYDEFELAVTRVIRTVRFDSDLVVSVFETNIRVLGGLLGAHMMAKALQAAHPTRMTWYSDQLLRMAHDCGTRLLPAFNTTTGMPYPRINLKYGMIGALRNQKETCTACAGTMVLEFAALSRLSGDPVFEAKAHKAMDFLWSQRHRGSDLMGTVLNIMNGDWVRRDAGIGAGIDSYYEYCLKAYILLGDQAYLHRFNKHYDAVMKYVNQGPLFVDVHMHKPLVASKNFMDSLLAFWPGLQVLSGDLKPAIEIHEMLYQVMQKHKFLPEAFTHDFQVHWGQWPLRPEFVESTYFLYKATRDPHYLHVGRSVIDAMNRYAKVPCGFAGVKDVRTMAHEDRMDSFLLAETFKYLYLLYASPEDLFFDVDSYVFTTEAHFLPLSIGENPPKGGDSALPGLLFQPPPPRTATSKRRWQRSCPNTRERINGELPTYARMLRARLHGLVSNAQSRAQSPTCNAQANHHRHQQQSEPVPSLSASEFSASDASQVSLLRRMGIHLETGKDGRVQLIHSAAAAESKEAAASGLRFMQEMVALAKEQEEQTPHEPRMIQLLSLPFLARTLLTASPAQFGPRLASRALHASPVVAEPFKACTAITNGREVLGRVALVERGGCMFVEKVRAAEVAGAVGVVVIDHIPDSSSQTQPLFAMSGDGGKTPVNIPSVFLFRAEGMALIHALRSVPGLMIRMSDSPLNPSLPLASALKGRDLFPPRPFCLPPKELQIPPPVQSQPNYIQIYRNEEGETCVKAEDGTEEVCYKDEDLSNASDTKEEEIIKPKPIEEQKGRETSLILEEALEEEKGASLETGVVLKATAVQVSVSADGVRHLRFNFAPFLQGDIEEAVKSILQSLSEETNIGELEPKFGRTVEALARMTAGQNVLISAEDDANLSALATLLRSTRGPAQPNLPPPLPIQKEKRRLSLQQATSRLADSPPRPPPPTSAQTESSDGGEAERLEDGVSDELLSLNKPPSSSSSSSASSSLERRCRTDASGRLHCTPSNP